MKTLSHLPEENSDSSAEEDGWDYNSEEADYEKLKTQIATIREKAQERSFKGWVVPCFERQWQTSELLDFCKVNKLQEFVPLVQDYYRRSGYPIEAA